MPAALRHFRVAILIQIGVERNERVIERIALDPDPHRTRLGCRDSYFIDATGVPFQRQLPGLVGFDPELPVVNGSFRQFGAHGWQEPDGVRMRQADGPFGVDRPIVRMLIVEQFAGAGWRPRSSER